MERAQLLRSIADTLAANREKYQEIARRNSGNTASDAAIDIDGGIGTLKFFSRLGGTLGEGRWLMEQGSDQLAKEDVFRAGHVWTSRPGAAIHINAFNFPSWGLWEKAAVAILSGVPVVAKPASATAWLSCEMVEDVVNGGLLPEGSLSLICGSGEGLLDAVGPFDCLAFTGSSETAALLRHYRRAGRGEIHPDKRHHHRASKARADRRGTISRSQPSFDGGRAIGRPNPNE